MKDNNIIQYINLKELNPEEQAVVTGIFDKEYEKIHRLFSGNLLNLLVHTKVHDKGGKKKYSVHIRAEAPTKIFATKKAVDWNLKTATRKAIAEIKNHVSHEFKHQHNKKEAFKLKRMMRKTTRVV